MRRHPRTYVTQFPLVTRQTGADKLVEGILAVTAVLPARPRGTLIDIPLAPRAGPTGSAMARKG